MKRSMLQRVFEHMWWADEREGTALGSLSGPASEVLELYGHIRGAEIIWLDRIEGSAQSAEVWPSGELKDVLRHRLTSKMRYADFLDGLDEADLSTLVSYTNSAGENFKTPVGDILLHVALHGAYHRGQIALVIRRSGGVPAPTDYIAFVRGAAAATRDSAGPNA